MFDQQHDAKSQATALCAKALSVNEKHGRMANYLEYSTGTYMRVHLLDDMYTIESSASTESDGRQTFVRCRASSMAARNVGQTVEDGSWMTYR